MKKKNLVGVIIAIIFAIIIGISMFVTYMVNNGHTKTSSETEENFYNNLDELEELEKLEEEQNQNIEDNSNNISFIKVVISKLIISKVNANEELHPISFNYNTRKLLEKYYILSKLDMSVIPNQVFIYGRKHWKEFPRILNSFDYLNKTHTLQSYIKYKKEFAKKQFYQETINQELIDIIENYFKNKKHINNITFLPKDINDDESFKFMIDGLKNHKYLLSTTKTLGTDLEFDSTITLAAILTEQFRYAGTYRGYVKSYLKKTPFIFSMTKFSYGIGGIKELTGYQIYKDANTFGYGKVFNNEKNSKYKDFSKKEILKDEYWETVYPNMLIKNIITRWERKGFSIRNKPGIILTLYNFGNNINKKPHENPKIGGAIIKLNEKDNRKYTFGGLGESLYYYIKVYGLYK